jgi:vacuolar protein sorting-associated protein 13A/C
MFKNQIVFYLNKYLGEYVYGLDAESLRISLWQGDVELKNLQLKPEALQKLDLPIHVKAGLLGRLTLKVRAVLRMASMHKHLCNMARGMVWSVSVVQEPASVVCM